ncbi:hypothetical protein FKR81_29335 [Lentzea tibetensis]|uniref:McrBC 5-methylcytosine restriction system component n=1 Tax=Lentzea tibetensis TaxID=2591470 RepID=A0A563ELR4_9PSEU|nr:hypothetical protein FKR81_29335 [Lentzea tibetensis]
MGERGVRRRTPVRRPARRAAEAALLARQFPSCDTETARTTLRRQRHHRMNVHYFAAHNWAALLLRTGGVADLMVQHELPGESRLLDMFRLWESVVHRMVGSTTISPIHVRRPSGTAYFRPDAVARLSTGTVAVDAKYKDYDDRNVSREDVHQLLTYSSAYRASETPRAVIVHPSESTTTSERITVDFEGRVLGVIDVIGIDVRVHPEDNSLHLKTLLSS